VQLAARQRLLWRVLVAQVWRLLSQGLPSHALVVVAVLLLAAAERQEPVALAVVVRVLLLLCRVRRGPQTLAVAAAAALTMAGTKMAALAVPV
jgi:FtsH-binding integral membrane protein